MCQYKAAYKTDNSNGNASKAQYIRQFKKWKFEKNLHSDQWKRIAKVVRNRKSNGKDSEVLIRDGRLSDSRLRKEMSRYRPNEHDDCSGTCARLSHCIKLLTWIADLTLEDMEGVIVGTPQGQAVQIINYSQIPLSQTPTEPYCKLRIFRA